MMETYLDLSPTNLVITQRRRIHENTASASKSDFILDHFKLSFVEAPPPLNQWDNLS